MLASRQTLPQELGKALERARVTPTPLCDLLLSIAVDLTTQKKQRRNELSCTGIFMAAVALGEALGRPNSTLLQGMELMAFDATEVAGLQNFTRVVLEKHSRDWTFQEARNEYFGDSAKTRAERHEKSFRISSSLHQALDSAAGTNPVPVARLIASVMSIEQAQLRSRLTRLGLEAQKLIAALDVPSASTAGTAIGIETSSSNRPGSRSANAISDEASTSERVSPSDRTSTEPHPPTARQSNFGLRIYRDDASELVQSNSLGVDTYAAALASVLRTARGEFCLGLFGPWGAGKSFLASRLRPLLSTPNAYATAMRQRGFVVGSDIDFRRRYEVIHHSAWKFRRTPEAWIFLYEAFADRCLAAKSLERFGRVLRIGVRRHGYVALITALLTIGVFALPFDTVTRLLLAVAGAFGLGSLMYALGVIRHTRQSISTVAAQYMTLVRHAEKLGLQALIGQDLRALVVGWIPRVEDGSKVYHAFGRMPLKSSVVALTVFTAAWLTLMLLPKESVSAIVSTTELEKLCGVIFDKEGFWCARSKTPPTMAAQGIVFGAWTVVWIFLLWLIHGQSGTVDRILLVVDDLDRCSPTEMLELVEALKLLLEDEEINARVQVLMLVDEELLDHAIAGKFRELIAERSASAAGARKAYARQDVIHEHKEKLFACHLRLPPLDQDSVVELAELFSADDYRKWKQAAEENLRAQIARRQQDLSPRRPSRETDVTVRPGLPQRLAIRLGEPEMALPETRTEHIPEEGEEEYKRRIAAATSELTQLKNRLDQLANDVTLSSPRESDSSSPANFDAKDLRFDALEIKLLKETLAMHVDANGRRLSPRAIRLFLFKYQLCRSLLQLSGDEEAKELLVSQEGPGLMLVMLGEHCFGWVKPPPGTVATAPDILQLAVAQVG